MSKYPLLHNITKEMININHANNKIYSFNNV